MHVRSLMYINLYLTIDSHLFFGGTDSFDKLSEPTNFIDCSVFNYRLRHTYSVHRDCAHASMRKHFCALKTLKKMGFLPVSHYYRNVFMWPKKPKLHWKSNCCIFVIFLSVSLPFSVDSMWGSPFKFVYVYNTIYTYTPITHVHTIPTRVHLMC